MLTTAPLSCTNAPRRVSLKLFSVIRHKPFKNCKCVLSALIMLFS
uniref:Uncharacterized protein n=1 Tax=Rhizophora mucronata TaxID=61149 RepID=A0A2P2QJW6_RHIMU